MGQRELVLLEALLLLGLGKELLESLVLHQSGLPPPVRVLLGMCVVIGAFGGLWLVFQRPLQRGLLRAQRAVRRLPVPTPLLAVHGMALGLIFLAYAWFWDAETGALAHLAELLQTVVST